MAKNIRESPIEVTGSAKASKRLCNMYRNYMRREVRKEQERAALVGQDKSEFLNYQSLLEDYEKVESNNFILSNKVSYLEKEKTTRNVDLSGYKDECMKASQDFLKEMSAKEGPSAKKNK